MDVWAKLDVAKVGRITSMFNFLSADTCNEANNRATIVAISEIFMLTIIVTNFTLSVLP